jgi:2-polyprenyl-3-methyl-5-hydroxy-6-metoxy-1,4-benzoquinol methylase
MSNPHDTAATLARVYGAMEDRAEETDSPAKLRVARERLALVRRHYTGRGRLLDVGCATGTFVGEAAKDGFTAVGLEASRWAVDRARAQHPAARFTLGRLEDAAIERGVFDVITLWDVLEHVRSPTETLRRLHGWLAPEGHLFLHLPDARSATAMALGRHWPMLLREHLHYFSRTTLAKLLRRAGFLCVDFQASFAEHSVAGIAARLSQQPGAVGRVFGGLVPRGALGRAMVRVPTGEMFAVARKLPEAAPLVVDTASRHPPERRGEEKTVV